MISPSTKKVLETVEAALAEHASPSKLVFDFKEVTRIDGAGLGMFMKIYTEILPRGGKIAVINISDHIRNVIVKTRLITILKCFKSQ